DRMAPQHVAHAVLLDLTNLGSKQLHLDQTRLDQGMDLRLGDGGDVVKPGLSQVLDGAAFDHPRSPTNVTRSQPKRSLAFFTCAANVFGSCVLPRKTSVETGVPACRTTGR